MLYWNILIVLLLFNDLTTQHKKFFPSDVSKSKVLSGKYTVQLTLADFNVTTNIKKSHPVRLAQKMMSSCIVFCAHHYKIKPHLLLHRY